MKRSRYDKRIKFFNARIDVENRGFVNLDQWIMLMAQHVDEYDEDIAIRVHHLICFMANKQDKLTGFQQPVYCGIFNI